MCVLYYVSVLQEAYHYDTSEVKPAEKKGMLVN